MSKIIALYNIKSILTDFQTRQNGSVKKAKSSEFLIRWDLLVMLIATALNLEKKTIYIVIENKENNQEWSQNIRSFGLLVLCPSWKLCTGDDLKGFGTFCDTIFTPKEWFLSKKGPKEGERVARGHFHESVGETPVRLLRPDMIFVQNLALPYFQAKNCTPQKCVNCDIFSCKLTT